MEVRKRGEWVEVEFTADDKETLNVQFPVEDGWTQSSHRPKADHVGVFVGRFERTTSYAPPEPPPPFETWGDYATHLYERGLETN